MQTRLLWRFAALTLAGCGLTGCGSMNHRSRGGVETPHLVTNAESALLHASPQFHDTVVVNGSSVPAASGVVPIPAAAESLMDDHQLIACWDEFGDPRLRWVMELALHRSDEMPSIEQRLLSAGYPASEAAPQDRVGHRRALLIQLARSVADARYCLHDTELIEHQIDMARGQIKLAEQRSGSRDSDETRALQNVHRKYMNSRSRLVTHRDRAIANVETLIGRPLTDALRNALGDQPSFRLGRVKQQIPADELRNRCDVQTAARGLKSEAYRSKIPETQWMAALSLRGAIHADPSTSSDPKPIDPMAIELGQLGPLSLTVPGADGGTVAASRLQSSMTAYHGVVTSAAQRTQELLTRYVELRETVDELQQRYDAAIEKSDDLAERYELDRLDVTELTRSQDDAIDKGSELHRAEHELAMLAIDLFVAIGGPCRWETHRPVSY